MSTAAPPITWRTIAAAIVGALAGLPGAVHDDDRPTAPIPVLQVVDEDAADYDVRLDLSGHIDLAALAAAIQADPAARDEWHVLRHNQGSSRAIFAAAELRRMPAIRAALTVKLDPAEAGLAADSLAERLEQAALEPGRCEHWSGDCNRFATGDDVYCPEHLADVQEHGPEGDRGSYDPWAG